MEVTSLLPWLVALVSGWVFVRVGGKLARSRGASVQRQIGAGFLFAVILRVALVGTLSWLEADGLAFENDWWSLLGPACLGAALWSATDWMSLEARPDPYAFPGRGGTYVLGALVALPTAFVAITVVVVMVMRPRAAREVEALLQPVRYHVDAHEEPRRCLRAIDRFEELADEDRISMRAGGVGLWVGSMVDAHARGDAGWRLWCAYAIGVADGDGQPGDLTDEAARLAD